MIRLILHKRRSPQTNIQLTLLLITIGGSTMLSSTWILKILYKLYFSSMDYRMLRFWIRLTWACNTVHYHSLSIFIESLVKKKNLLKNRRQKILIPISGMLFLFFFFLSLIKFNQPVIKPAIEVFVIRIVPYYYLFPLLLISLFMAVTSLRSAKIPRLLKKQFNTFITIIFLPVVAAEIIHFQPIRSLYVTRRYTITCITMIILTYALYYCIKKIMGLRFLNLQTHVQAEKKFNFVDDFKNVLEKLSHITNKREIIHITKSFFKDAFSIPIQKTRLYIRTLHKDSGEEEEIGLLTKNEKIVEAFLTLQAASNQVESFLVKEKILIADELEFTNFYEEEETIKNLIAFLHSIHADIFLPVYEKNELIGYIIIEKNARTGHIPKNLEFYSNVERDQMIVFANYLGNILHFMKSKNLKKILKHEKDLKDLIFLKNREIDQYKESIQSFFKNSTEKDIGIIFYKNRQFIMGNQIAQRLLKIDLNIHTGHPMTRKITYITKQVVEYKIPQTFVLRNRLKEKLILSIIADTKNNNAIILVRLSEISDILDDKIHMLKDPTKWEYLLYLETTKAGKIINQFIPSHEETLLQVKINILKAALGKNAVLLDIPEDDLPRTVEVLHLIGKREKLEILDLYKPVTNFDIAITLFGASSIFGLNNKKRPLLEKLDKTGTLCVKNIHFLDMETQKYLANYLKYGVYKNFKGNHIKTSNTKIICSTNIDLESEVLHKRFDNNLFMQLNKMRVSIPPLTALSKKTIEHLIIELAKQAIKIDEFHAILELTESEKRKIIESNPKSIYRIKEKIKQTLIQKSKKQSIYEETQFDPAYDIADPKVVEAARLGKYALKDPKIMALLWDKFKNQNKIAHFLGVNRSSVNRRCKDYNLL